MEKMPDLIFAFHQLQLSKAHHMRISIIVPRVSQPSSDLDPSYPLVGTSIIFTVAF